MLYMKENLNISHTADRGFSMPRHHFHDFYEIYFTATGGATYFIGDQIFSVEPNDLFVFNQYDLHHTMVPTELLYDRYVVTFKPDFIRSWSTGEEGLLDCFEKRSGGFCHKLHLTTEQAARLLPLLNPPPALPHYPILHQKTVLAELLLTVNSFYKTASQLQNLGIPPMAAAKLQPVLQHIQTHLADDLSLDQLAEIAYMNKFYFCKTFKKVIGFTPNEYISLRRIMTATELLLQGLTVTEAAEAVGYQTDTYFITKFKSYWNIPPKQFVKLKQQETAVMVDIPLKDCGKD